MSFVIPAALQSHFFSKNKRMSGKNVAEKHLGMINAGSYFKSPYYKFWWKTHEVQNALFRSLCHSINRYFWL